VSRVTVIWLLRFKNLCIKNRLRRAAVADQNWPARRCRHSKVGAQL